MAVTLVKRRFTVEEYNEMGRAGILKPGDRVELIEGEIIQMSPIGSRHAACVAFLTQVFVTALGRRAIVQVQNPVRIGDSSEPQPDVMLLKVKGDFYASGHPGPSEVLLLVEVVDTSVDTDRETKIPLYARAGFGEVWLVDLGKGRIEIFRDSDGEKFRSIEARVRGTVASPVAFPEVQVPVDRLP